MIKNPERQKALDEFNKTGDILRLQKQLGHKNVKSTFALLVRSGLLKKHLEGASTC